MSFGQSRVFGIEALQQIESLEWSILAAIMIVAFAFTSLPKARGKFLLSLVVLCFAVHVIGYSFNVQTHDDQVVITDSRPVPESTVQATRQTALMLVPGLFAWATIPSTMKVIDASIGAIIPTARNTTQSLPLADVGLFLPISIALNLFITLMALAYLGQWMQRRGRAAGSGRS